MNSYSNEVNIYLDACATTPPHPNVIKKVTQAQSATWGNPSSLHRLGIESSTLLEVSRSIFCDKLFALESEIIFTSGATESINLAIIGYCKSVSPGRIVISQVEHPSVFSAAKLMESCGWEILLWPVDTFGHIRLDLLDEVLSPPTKFVSIVWGQSEIGTTQPINLIGEECRKRSIVFHTDATQVLPHGLFNWKSLPIDLLTASAHKMYGPKGTGLLMKRSDLEIIPLLSGGPQEHYLRSGTEPVALIAGFAEALLLIDTYLQFEKGYTVFCENKVNYLTNKLRAKIVNDLQLSLTGHSTYRLPNHLSFIAKDKAQKPIDARKLVRKLSNLGIFISSGTACKSGITEDSPVLKSIAVTKNFRQSGIRLSLGPWIKENELDKIKNLLEQTINDI